MLRKNNVKFALFIDAMYQIYFGWMLSNILDGCSQIKMLSPGASSPASCWPEEKVHLSCISTAHKGGSPTVKRTGQAFYKNRACVNHSHTGAKPRESWRRTGGLLLFTKQGGCESLTWWPSAKHGLFICKRRGGGCSFCTCCCCHSTKPGEALFGETVPRFSQHSVFCNK